MKINPVYYQTYNYSATQNQQQKLNNLNSNYAHKYIQKDAFMFTGSTNMLDKAKNLGKKIVDKTKETFSDFSSLFTNQNIELSKEEETFINSYFKKEAEIKAEYDKKIAAIKDGFWDHWTNGSEKERQKLREEKTKALKVAYAYQDLFEQREQEAIANKNKFAQLAKQLNMSKEILAAFESSQLSSQRRLDIIKRRKELLDKKGFSKIAGYLDEKSKIQTEFLDKLDDEKSGKYLATPIPNAILFYGPTGCGKTTFVKALAEEADCNLETIQCRGTQKAKEQQIYDTLMGYEDNEIEVPGLLEKAQEEFLKTGKRTIILIDEFDRFFGKDVSNKFISEMKGILESCSEDNHVTFFLTTNKPQKIPYELRNSHRIEPSYPLDPPNKTNAVAVIEHYLQGCIHRIWITILF